MQMPADTIASRAAQNSDLVPSMKYIIQDDNAFQGRRTIGQQVSLQPVLLSCMSYAAHSANMIWYIG